MSGLHNDINRIKSEYNVLKCKLMHGDANYGTLVQKLKK